MAIFFLLSFSFYELLGATLYYSTLSINLYHNAILYAIQFPQTPQIIALPTNYSRLPYSTSLVTSPHTSYFPLHTPYFTLHTPYSPHHPAHHGLNPKPARYIHHLPTPSYPLLATHLAFTNTSRNTFFDHPLDPSTHPITPQFCMWHMHPR